jgi:uncharacterized Fe-S cluster protein YjdI
MSDRLQVYETDQVRVSFDPKRCMHSGVCLRALPAVFDVSRRRWIDPARASAEDVMAAVAKCPSGALQSALVTAVHPSISRPGPTTPAGDPVSIESTDPTRPVKITVRERDGLLVEGPFKVVDAAGNVLREGDKCTLCRCGHSRTKPFCDNTHTTVDVDW